MNAALDNSSLQCHMIFRNHSNMQIERNNYFFLLKKILLLLSMLKISMLIFFQDVHFYCHFSSVYKSEYKYTFILKNTLLTLNFISAV